jgi:hypothetical protein
MKVYRLFLVKIVSNLYGPCSKPLECVTFPYCPLSWCHLGATRTGCQTTRQGPTETTQRTSTSSNQPHESRTNLLSFSPASHTIFERERKPSPTLFTDAWAQHDYTLNDQWSGYNYHVVLWQFSPDGTNMWMTGILSVISFWRAPILLSCGHASLAGTE